MKEKYYKPDKLYVRATPRGRTKSLRAFSLLELLTVLVILSLLATVAILVFANKGDEAKQRAFEQTVNMLKTQGQAYLLALDTQPAEGTDIINELIRGGYIKEKPVNPLGTEDFKVIVDTNGVILITPVLGNDLILNKVTGAVAAYSLRKLNKNYIGYAVRVRSSAAGNPEQSIRFDTNGEVSLDSKIEDNVTSFRDWIGSNSGYVTIWYDQAGTNNAIQTTLANQPRIINAGSLEVDENSVIWLYFDSTDFLQNSMILNQPITINLIARTNGTSGEMFDDRDSTQITLWLSAISGTYKMYVDQNLVSTENIDTTKTKILTTIWNSPNSYLYSNGVQKANGITGTSGFSLGLKINARFSGASTSKYWQEFLVFDSAVDVNKRQILEDEQGAYYGITVTH